MIPNLVLKLLNYSNRSQFLINKDKNRGRFFVYIPSSIPERDECMDQFSKAGTATLVHMKDVN
jgi:hypothetical protein